MALVAAEIENVVFAGGGNRCFWQAGFWRTVTKDLPIQPKRIASVSAGSAISSALFSGKFEETFEITKEVMSRNAKNRYLENLLNKNPVYPHSVLYREIIMRSINNEALRTLQTGPENRILVAHLPPYLGPRSSVLLGIGAYQMEKMLLKPVHPKLGRALGFSSEFLSNKDCNSVEALADAILSSSCTPPFTPLMYRHGKPVLDGGMVDNVPVHGVAHESGKTLVLLSRPYKKLPQTGERIYVQPSQPVPVKSWDYTSPEKVSETYALGVKDGFAFLKHYSKSSNRQ